MSNEEKEVTDEETLKVEEANSLSNNNELSPKTEKVPISIIQKSPSATENALTSLQLKVDGVLKEECNDKEKPIGDPVSFKVVFNKTKYDIEFPIQGTVKQLKEHLAPIINVLPTMQKVMIKGMAKDEKTLEELGVTKGAKVMVVGSKLNDVVNVNAPKTESPKSESSSGALSTKEPLCKQKLHQKILDKGIPEDATPGIKNCKEALPFHPLSGMLNKQGGKVRLTFKLELDQLWVGTKERTEKINMNTIQQVVSEKIEGHEEYHILTKMLVLQEARTAVANSQAKCSNRCAKSSGLEDLAQRLEHSATYSLVLLRAVNEGLQLGPTEASRYWIYWVPAQYVDAIKDTVLGKW